MCASARYLGAQTALVVISAIERWLYSPEVITVSGDGTETRWQLPFLIVLSLETLDAIIGALRRLTGKKVGLTDLLEYREE